MFTKISEIVPQYFNKYNLSATAQAAQVVDIFEAVLKDIYGSELEAKALQVKDKIIIVQVSSNAMAQEIQLNKLDIIAKINEKFEEERVKDLRFKVSKEQVIRNS